MIQASNPEGNGEKSPLCIFGAPGAFTKELFTGDLLDSSGIGVPTRAYISPAVVRLAAMIARGKATPEVVLNLSIEARRGVGLLAARIAEIDRAIGELVKIMPGGCPAQGWTILSEILFGSLGVTISPIGEGKTP